MRPLLDSSNIDPAIAGVMAANYRDTVDEVIRAIGANDIVIVGMAQNPFCKQARQLLDVRGQAYKYLEYGSYFSEWKRRLALKLWCGWSTLPMVFVKGVLIGGKNDLAKLISSGELQRRLGQA